MKEKILVVDDEQDIRTLCKVNLEYEGYTVIEAGDGSEGLEILKAEDPDVVLLDVMMPRMDGWEFMRKAKEDEVTALIPIILLTAKADDSSQMQGWAEGIIDFVSKPFNPVILVKHVQKALSERDPEELLRRREVILQQLRLRKELKAPAGGGDGS